MEACIALKIMSAKLFFTYDFKEDECQICRKKLCETSIIEKDKTNFKTNNWNSVGTCGHVFHMSCIDSIKVNNFCSCPICNTTWKVKANVPCELS